MNRVWCVLASFVGVMLIAVSAYAVATTVTVLNGGVPQPNAKVKIQLDDGTTTEEKQTDDRGVAVIDFDRDKSGTATVTSDGQTYTQRVTPGSPLRFDVTTMAGGAAAMAAPVASESWTLGSYFKRGEFYAAGLIGYNFPNRLSDVRDAQNSSVHLSPLNLQNNLLYEGKIGYYCPPVWEQVRIGGELSVSFTNPNIKQQDTTISFPGGSVTGPLTGSHMRLWTFSYHFLLRWDGLGNVVPALKDISPYGGIGPSIGWFRIADDTGSGASTTLGYSAVYGLRWQTPIEHVGAWIEGSHRSYSPTFGKDVQLKGDYSDNSVKVGISFYWTGDQSKW
jgi:hypothetical protein